MKMNIECAEPLQCAVIHQLKTEFAEVKTQLESLTTAVHSLLQVHTAPVKNTVQPESRTSAENATVSDNLEPSESNNTLRNEEERRNEQQFTIDSNSTEKNSSLNEPLKSESFHFDIAECSEHNEIEKREIDLIPVKREPESSEFDISESNKTVDDTIDGLEKEIENPKRKLTHSNAESCKFVCRRSPQSSSPTNDTITILRQYCKECEVWVYTNGWFDHVVSLHFAKHALICIICGFKVKWHISNMKYHFAITHPGLKLKFIDKRGTLKPEIKKISDSLSAPSSHIQMNGSSDRSESTEIGKMASDLSDGKSASKGSNKDNFYCKKCETWVLSNRWFLHVVRVHCTRRAFMCLTCSFEAKWDISHMKRHINNSHPGERVKFTDKREEMKPYIRTISDSLKMTFDEKCGQA